MVQRTEIYRSNSKKIITGHPSLTIKTVHHMIYINGEKSIFELDLINYLSECCFTFVLHIF
jgi:hypothetical protein